MAKVSVALATYNEEKNINACLASVSGLANEIVVVEGGSTDRTIEIAEEYGARVIRTDNPAIFHINKQKAVDACTGDWILQLDADEVVTPDLAGEIKGIISKTRRNGFYIPRKNYFLGHWLSKGGQFPDYVIRLFRRGKGKFPCKSVHEQIEISGEVGYVKNPLLHYTARTLKEYWRKAHAYIALTAQELKEKKLSPNVFTYIQYNVVKPTTTFLSLFLRHKGFVDGVYGFLFAFFSALHHPLSYWQHRKIK